MKQQMTLQKHRRSVYGRPPKFHQHQNPMMEDCTSLRELLIEHVSLHQSSRTRQPQNLLKQLNQPVPGSPAASCIGWLSGICLPHADKPSLFRTCLIIAQIVQTDESLSNAVDRPKSQSESILWVQLSTRVCILQCPSDVGEVTTGGHVNMAFFATEDSKAMIGVITPDAPFVRHMVLVCGICKRA